MAQINKSSEYFNTHLYSGNDTTNNQSVGLTPDLVWVKCRNVGSPTQHYIVDKVRGNEKYISSNATTAEQTDSNTFELVSGGFNLDGGNGWTNLTGRNYVAWNWLGGGTGVSNTDGSITSTVSANTTSGFSIVKYTGNGTQSDQEIGTGLSTELKFVIAKPLEAGGTTSSWVVYVNGITDAQDNCLLLESTSGLITGASGGTPNKGTTAGNLLIKAGTSSNNNLNNSGTNYIAYCFAEKKGFSKFGSYVGNASGSDNAFVYCGFKPAYVMTKCTSIDGDRWTLYDNKRDPINPTYRRLFPDGDIAESLNTNADIDLLSNGFKIRTDAGTSGAAQTYIYMAFAEEPLVGTNNIPATAR